MKEQVQSDKFDAEALNKLIRSEFNRFESTVSSIVTEISDFHSALNSEQKVKLRELIGNWDGKQHRRHNADFCREIDAYMPITLNSAGLSLDLKVLHC